MYYATEAMMSITIGEALKELNSGGGTSMFIPSFGRKLLFKKVNTGIQKTIGRISLDSGDRYRSGLMRLALFDDLLLEGTREYRSSMLKTIDVIAFLCQLRMQTTDSVDIRFICPKCGSSTDVSISLKKVLENCGKHKFEEIDVSAEDKNTGRRYSFKICEPSYLDVAILTESIVSMKSSGTSISELEFYYIYSKLCLYIDSMSIDGKEIKGDNAWTLRIAIPASALFYGELKTWHCARLKGNFYKCGDALSTPHYITWAPISTPSPDYHRAEFFAEIDCE